MIIFVIFWTGGKNSLDYLEKKFGNICRYFCSSIGNLIIRKQNVVILICLNFHELFLHVWIERLKFDTCANFFFGGGETAESSALNLQMFPDHFTPCSIGIRFLLVPKIGSCEHIENDLRHTDT